MSNQIFHFSNTGVSSGQRFYLKDDVSGIFVRNLNIDSNFPVVASNLVYNTGNQTISGDTTFIDKIKIKAIDGSSVGYIEGTSVIGGNQTLKIQAQGQDENYIEINSAQNSINLGEDLFNITNNNGTLNFNSTNDENIAINGTRSLSADNISASFKEVLVNNRIDIKASDGQIVGYISGESLEESYQRLIINGVGGPDEQNVRIQSAGNSIAFGEGTFSISNNNGVLSFNGGDDIYINNTRNLVGSNISASFKEVSANNLVYNVNNQTISGIKTFASRPNVNGTGVSLIGEVGDNLVYTTGDQTISGIKTFATGVLISGNLQVSNTGIFNALNLNNIDALSLSGVDINIASGNVNLTNRPKINDTGVLLIGENLFPINFLSSNANLAVGQNYITNLGGPYTSFVVQRLVPIMHNCTARQASISLLNSGPGNNINLITGYFINYSKNLTGVISTSISAIAGNQQYTYTGTFSTPISISAGDFVTCSLFSNTIATNVRAMGTIYLYN